jgi:hypothetical protein
MADRYWVGGTAAWDGTAGSKWAATSGGAGGESVPTTADDVFFDAASSGTCTIASGNTGAKTIDCTGFTGTITGSATITVAGSITLDAGQTYTHTATVTITGTGTLTTAGKAFSALLINGSGITVTLGDALNISTRTLTVAAGTFDTASYSVAAGVFSSNNSNTRTVTLGSSSVALSGSSVWVFDTTTNLTFNAGTSTITATSTSTNTFNGAGLTYYNYTGGGGTSTINGSNTFNNVSFTRVNGTSTLNGSNTFQDLSVTVTVASTSLRNLVIAENQTVNGTLTCAGHSLTLRCFVLSNTLGTTRTITAAAVSANNCDLRDITIAGAAAPISPTGAGDCGGNSGITFPAARNIYRVGTNTTWVGSSSWALSSGGAGSNANFPLAQDTVIIDESTTLTGTLSTATYNIGAIDCSTRTTGIGLSHGFAVTRYGSYIFGTGVTVSGTSAQTFASRATQTFTSAGKTITFPITVNKPAGAFELGDALEVSNSITLTQGTFDAKNYNLTCTAFGSSNNNTRTITMGSGLWTISGTGNLWTIAGTDLTFNKDTADILFSDTSTTSRTFASGGQSDYNKITIGGATGTSTFSFQSSNVFAEIASTKTVAHTITFVANQTIGTWSVTGTSGNVVTVNSSSAGTRRTIDLTNSTAGTVDFLNVKDIGITNPDTFYVGNNSTDSGNNLNVIFNSGPGATATGNMFMLFN